MLIAFAISAPILILYALGYRYDGDTHALRKTATIALEFESQAIKTYFDDIFVADKKDSVVIPGVTSALHHITLTKNDAISWNQDVETSPGVVTWISNIILYRASLGKNAITSNVVAAKISATQNIFVDVVTTSGAEKPTKTLEIRDRKTQNVLADVTENEIKNTVSNVDSLGYDQMFFTQNDSWLIVPTVLTDKSKNYIVVSTKDASVFSLTSLVPANTALFADAKDHNVYFYVEDGQRKIVDLQNKNVSAKSKTLYAYHKSFTTYSIDSTLSNDGNHGPCILNETLDVIGSVKQLATISCGKFQVTISPSGNLLIQNIDLGSTMLFDTRSKNLTIINEKVDHAAFAAKPNSGEVLVYSSGSELRVLATSTGTRTLLTRTSEPINDITVSALGTHAYYISGKSLGASEVTFDRNPVVVSWDLNSPLPFLLPGSSEQTVFAAERPQGDEKLPSLYELTLYDL